MILKIKKIIFNFVDSRKLEVSHYARGFTLVEMVVVFSVLTILTGGVILYGNSSRAQIALLQDQYKLMNTFTRAKFLTLQFYQREVGIDCGYGVHLDPNGTFFIYKDKKFDRAENCQDLLSHNPSFSSQDEIVENSKGQLSSSLNFENLNVRNILFVAPYGHAMIIKGNSLEQEAVISISPKNSDNTVFIKVNQYGQISTQ